MPLTAIVTSPLDRCLETAEAIRDARRPASRSGRVDERHHRVRLRRLDRPAIKDLAKDPLWKVVQAQPSAVRFPGGEALAEMAARAVAAIREWDARLGDDAVWVACSHGDMIKAIVADALGLHLDQYQRIVPDPCSVSVIRYTKTRPYVHPGQRHRRRPGRVRAAEAPAPRASGADDATVGGGAGGGTV